MFLPVLGTLRFQRVHVFPEHPVGSSRLSHSRVIFLHSRSLGDLVHLVVPWCVSGLPLPPALETSQGKESPLSTIHNGPWQETVLRYLLESKRDRERQEGCARVWRGAGVSIQTPRFLDLSFYGPPLVSSNFSLSDSEGSGVRRREVTSSGSRALLAEVGSCHGASSHIPALSRIKSRFTP